jgi:hypothetical protein
MRTAADKAADDYSDDTNLKGAFHEGAQWLLREAKILSFRDAKLVEITALEALFTEDSNQTHPEVTRDEALNEPKDESPSPSPVE